ncbi:MAG: hypothetical protein JWR63_442 [Conexibacter sp.]|nr:hypothetical protein [Conexibacter sp.]
MTIRPRCLPALCAAVAALAGTGAVAATALADHTQRLDIAAELVRQPAGKPWIVNLSIGAQLGSTDGVTPAPVNHMVFSFTRGAKVHPEAFGTCTLAIIKDKGPDGCPSSSRLGDGKALAHALETDFPADIKVFNGPKAGNGRKIIIYARALGTVVIPLEGTLKRSSGRYGWVLDLPVPRIQTVGDNDAAILSFQVNVGGIGRRKVPFIEAPTSCTKPGWPFLGSFSYADGAAGTSSATIPCVLRAANDDAG